MSSSPNDPKHQEIYNKLASQDAAPLPLKKVLAKEQADYDCLSCRVMGATAFGTLGAYTYWSGHRELRTREAEIMKSGSRLTMAARRLGITGLSGTLVGLGLWRAFM
ncbi:hypothetical protein D6D17_03522 [Aureobasidium pullulans]|uniref:Distal membrane-arm assembly complex protein 1-like domain-containing protein n=1 Tax=Aureobasidium pullulans TaxID=5580 RepID=A0A4S9CY64_AURPU|nr:hypothetical protein D6D24_10679 [Aureobasidium pullulans]THX12641.1 hypothetical protein D6D17_03522 [Aureobasidium pullulans]